MKYCDNFGAAPKNYLGASHKTVFSKSPCPPASQALDLEHSQDSMLWEVSFLFLILAPFIIKSRMFAKCREFQSVNPNEKLKRKSTKRNSKNVQIKFSFRIFKVSVPIKNWKEKLRKGIWRMYKSNLLFASFTKTEKTRKNAFVLEPLFHEIHLLTCLFSRTTSFHQAFLSSFPPACKT